MIHEIKPDHLHPPKWSAVISVTEIRIEDCDVPIVTVRWYTLSEKEEPGKFKTLLDSFHHLNSLCTRSMHVRCCLVLQNFAKFFKISHHIEY
jgi:hypothetical protein